MKKKKENFFKGVAILMLSQIIIKILGMVYSLYLTNKKGFGDEGNAICMAGFQIYALFLGICTIGIPNALSKMISENIEIGDEGTCLQILKISLVIFTIIGFLFCCILYYGSDFIANKILYIDASSDILKILAPSIVFSTVEAVFRGYFNGLNKISISAKSAAIEQVLKTILTIIGVEVIGEITNNNTVIMTKISMLSASISTISSFIYVIIKYKKINRDNISIKIKNKKSIRMILTEIFSIVIPISITTMFMILENNIDSITIVRILKNKIGETEARKIYGIITSKVNLILNLPLALNGAISVSLVPEISRNVIKLNREKLKKSINSSIIMSFFISIPIMFGCIVYANSIMLFLYPNAPKGGILLKLGAVTIVFSCLIQNISGILQGIGDSKTHLYAVIFGSILKIILNYLLLSNDKILENGAIISTVISNILIFFIMYKKFNKKINIDIPVFYNFIRISVFSIIAICVAKIIFKNINFLFQIKFMLEVVVVVIIYLCLIVKFKVLKFK